MPCNCTLFVRTGNCHHLRAWRPTFRSDARHRSQVVDKPSEPLAIRHPRTVPPAVERMFDFLDLCEEVKPGSSGMAPVSHRAGI
jgi:hypothetical protein